VRVAVDLVPATDGAPDGATSDAARRSVRVAFRVIDTGIGMTEEQRERLFRPYSQADSSTTRLYEGTGLGLVMVRRLVELQSGALLVESEPGKGTRFTVWLPLRDPEPAGQLPIALPDSLLRPITH